MAHSNFGLALAGSGRWAEAARSFAAATQWAPTHVDAWLSLAICRERQGRLADARQAWFVVHAPRQSGKTTTTRLAAEALTAAGRYAAVLASCKPGSTAGDDVEGGVDAAVHSLNLRLALLYG